MLDQYKKKAKIGIIIGILSFIVGFGIISPESGEGLSDLGMLFVFAGYILLVWGCWHWVKGKGYHGAWGFLGLMHFVGIIVIAFFPDKKKQFTVKEEFSEEGEIKRKSTKSLDSMWKKRTIKDIRVSNKIEQQVKG